MRSRCSYNHQNALKTLKVGGTHAIISYCCCLEIIFCQSSLHDSSFIILLSPTPHFYTFFCLCRKFVSHQLNSNSNNGGSKEATRIYSMREGLTMAAYVGQRRGPLRLSRSEADARFSDGVGENAESQNAYHILCHPIIRADGDLSGVIELHRNNINSPFYAEDEEVVNSYVVWGGIALHYAELNAVMNKSKKLNEFLLDVVR